MQKNKNYLNKITEYNVREAWPAPRRCALLVIDMQQYFISIASPILGRVQSVIEACRESGMRAIFTRHGHRNLAQDGGMLGKWWGDGIMRGSKEWEVFPALSPHASDNIIDKNRYSAFYGTDLAEHLKARKTDELIITGVMTNCCCETTARDGFVRDYRIFFVSDATAAINEELHVASLKTLAYGFAHVVDTDALCRHLKKRS